jgi:NAD(P)-dependent dehydrogenase (short-subunit alcohol dehydrogenase family)
MQTAIDDYINASAPLKRWGKPQEVARSVLFLASDDAAYITGGDMLVDGGWG